MQKLSLSEAVKASHKAKSTILEAIKTGRLSVERDEKGRYLIDPAELFRVYPIDQTENQNRPEESNEKTAFLIEKIAILERQLAKAEADRDRERQQLEAQIKREQEQGDHWRQQATNLLTHQPEPAQPQKSGLLARLFRGKPPQ